MSSDISSIRQDYRKQSLSEDTISENAVVQFKLWFEEAVAAALPEVNAMHLCTVSKDGKPSGRIVLLKGILENEFQFFTNYNSAKAKAIDENPNVSITFFWPELERQVRVEGKAHKLSAEVSDAYFASRPHASQIGAWASSQSSVIENRTFLEEENTNISTQFEGKVIPRPPHWGGFGVIPETIEFWQGRPSRLHDRLLYSKLENSWKIVRLAP